MADKKIALDLEVNIKKGDMTLGELNKQLETLGTTIDEQKEILIEFERELLELESIQSKTSKTDLARQTSLKEKSEQLKGAIKDQKLSIKELTTEKNKAATASKDLAKDTAGEADAIQALDGVTGGAATKFKNLTGVLGKVVNSFKTLKVLSLLQV
jgi:chromosome segregation ATPase